MEGLWHWHLEKVQKWVEKGSQSSTSRSDLSVRNRLNYAKRGEVPKVTNFSLQILLYYLNFFYLLKFRKMQTVQ